MRNYEKSSDLILEVLVAVMKALIYWWCWRQGEFVDGDPFGWLYREPDDGLNVEGKERSN